jgi:F-type H+-transporting ATPase subunit delta
MAKVSDKELALSRVYSTAMLRLAEAHGEADRLLEELAEIGAYFDKNAEFAAFLTSPTVDAKAREKTIEKVFRGKVSDLCADSLQILNRKDRLGLLRALVETYRAGHEELRGQVEVHVQTVVPLSAEMKAKIEQIAERQTKKKPTIMASIDESIIGGLIVRIGDRKYDMSVATHIREIGDCFAERASKEVQRSAAYVA